MNSAISFHGSGSDTYQINSSSGNGNVISPAAHYIFGAGNYMTYHPDQYYPNACLFCGLPNGAKKEAISTPTSTSQEIIVATAAPTMQFHSAGTNGKSEPVQCIGLWLCQFIPPIGILTVKNERSTKLGQLDHSI
ncbi:hypothetical protein [Parasitella parasitica]|uniref:Uncharacterized protein n=1 Tax=Parasitella parasitica TaxID=35722 RepID=A0A0B7N9J2_9FUNG|nr:hypothetical protein [Parasitella parasitica]